MKLEAGKRYITRDGRTTTPLTHSGHSEFPYVGHLPEARGSGSYLCSWTDLGAFSLGASQTCDLVAEYTEPAPDTIPEDVKKSAGSVKPWLAGMPPIAEELICAVLKSGADKYGPWNWRETGLEMETYVSAIKRHLNAIHRGEWLDPESKLPHLAHIGASCCLLLDSDHHGVLKREVAPAVRKEVGS